MKTGDVIVRRFALGQIAGTGGHGAGVPRDRPVTGTTVAVKVLTTEAGSRVDLGRFEREAALVAELRHPHIVGYVDHGLTESGAPYLAMEWVEGTTLSARLRAPLPCADAVALVRAVAAALSVAHARGIVHRDIKPANVMLEDGDLTRPGSSTSASPARPTPTRSSRRPVP